MPEGDALVAALQPELAKHFKPAFLGRVTIVPYLPLTEPVLLDIAKLQVARIAERLAARETTLEVSPAVATSIVKRCLSGSIGARAIEGVLAREVLPLISDLILDRTLAGEATHAIHVDASDGHFVVSGAADRRPNDSQMDDLQTNDLQTSAHVLPDEPFEQPVARPTDCDHPGDRTAQAVDLAQA